MCGIATYSEALAEGLAEEGSKVYITRLHRFSVKDEKYIETLAVRRIPKCDVIHVQHEYGLYVSPSMLEDILYGYLKTHDTPIVTTMHATGIRKDVDDTIATGSDEVIVHNEWMKQQLGYKCMVIPHGCQPNKTIGKDSARGLLGMNREMFVLGNFGVMAPHKGLEEVFEALRALPDVQLVLTGGWHVEAKTNYIDEMKRKAERLLPNRVTWLGWVPAHRLPIIFGACDACITNHRYASESGSLLTAIGYGKCVITSNHPAFKEKEGVVLTHSGADDLIAKLKMLKDCPEEIVKHEEAARNYAEEHSWKNTAKCHLDLYKELV